jgi:hypothetical protein
MVESPVRAWSIVITHNPNGDTYVSLLRQDPKAATAIVVDLAGTQWFEEDLFDLVGMLEERITQQQYRDQEEIDWIIAVMSDGSATIDRHDPSSG